MLAFLFGIFGTDYFSNRIYAAGGNTYEMEEIKDALKDTDVGLVYVWVDDWNIGGRVYRVLDTSRVYKCVPLSNTEFRHWGDYLEYEYNEDYTGATALICARGQKNVPQHILSQYSILKKLKNHDVYVSDKNPVDFTSGFTSENSIDYPYTPGMTAEEAYTNDNGDFIIDASTDGCKLTGPGAPTVDGSYDFILHYSVISPGVGDCIFDIAVDGERVAYTAMPPDIVETVISGLDLEEGHILDYRIFTPKQALVKVEKIEIKRHIN